MPSFAGESHGLKQIKDAIVEIHRDLMVGEVALVYTKAGWIIRGDKHQLGDGYPRKTVSGALHGAQSYVARIRDNANQEAKRGPDEKQA